MPLYTTIILICIFPASSIGAGPPALVDSLIVPYPDLAYAAEVEGTVRLAVDVDARGIVTGVEILDGVHPMLDAAVRYAVREAAYRPAIDADGQPCDGRLSLNFEFDRTREFERRRRAHSYIPDWPSPRISDVSADTIDCRPFVYQLTIGALPAPRPYRGIQVYGDVSARIADEIIAKARFASAPTDSMLAMIVYNAFPYTETRLFPEGVDARVSFSFLRFPTSEGPDFRFIDFERTDEGSYQLRNVITHPMKIDPPYPRAVFLDSIPPSIPDDAPAGMVTVVITVDRNGRYLRGRIASGTPPILNQAALTAAAASTYRPEPEDCRQERQVRVHYWFP